MSDDITNYKAEISGANLHIDELQKRVRAAEERAEKAERENAELKRRMFLERKPADPSGSGYCPGACEYRELLEAIRLAEAQAAGMAEALKNAVIMLTIAKRHVPNDAVKEHIRSTGETLKIRGLADTLEANIEVCRQALSLPTGKEDGGKDYDALIRLKDAVEATLCIETPKEVREALEAVRR